MRIGLIGTGNVGEALAKRLVAVGHSVKAANSRGAHSLAAFAGKTGAQPADVAEVTSGVDLLILAIPIERVRDLPKRLFDSLSEFTVVLDTANYQPLLNGRIPEIDQGLAEAAWVSSQLGVPVVKAFNSMTAYSMGHYGRPKGAQDRIAVPVAGDHARSRALVMRLVEEIGFTAYDAGPLAESWRQQPGQPAYATDPSAKELPALLKRADRQQAPKNRDKAMALMAKLPAGFPMPDLVRVARLSVGLDKLKPSAWLAMLRLVVAMARSKPSGMWPSRASRIG